LRGALDGFFVAIGVSMPTNALFQILVERLCAAEDIGSISSAAKREILNVYGSTVEGRAKLIEAFAIDAEDKQLKFRRSLTSGVFLPPFSDSTGADFEEELTTLRLILAWIPISEQNTAPCHRLRLAMQDIEKVYFRMLELAPPTYRRTNPSTEPEIRPTYTSRYERVLSRLL
jgi:hypothetical protein